MISPFREVNSEGEYLHVQASGFRDTKFPAVIFRPKNAPVLPSELGKGPGLSKRSDLRRIDTGQYKKNLTGEPCSRMPFQWITPSCYSRKQKSTSCHKRTHQGGTKAARSQLCIITVFLFFRAAACTAMPVSVRPVPVFSLSFSSLVFLLFLPFSHAFSLRFLRPAV